MNSENILNILAIGDIVGRAGRKILHNRLQGLVDLYAIDYVIANGENAAGGMSITPAIVSELLSMGINVITSGNHIWDKKEVLKIINNEPSLLRPANFPEGNSGNGYKIDNCRGVKVCVINLQGRSMMAPIDCPFRKFDEIYNEVKDISDIIIVDFHAEATSEKKAFGWYADGRVSAVFGTHTHVQTSDEEILPEGTGYITDIGMTGAFNSVIGMNKEQSIQRFLTQVKVKYEVASGNPKINGIIMKIDQKGKTMSLQRLIV